MTELTNPVTGHQIRTDADSVEFWKASGYRELARKAPAKKAAPKKSSK